MKRLTKTLLATAAILAVAALPVMAAGPGGGFGAGKGDCPGYGQQISEKLKLTAPQKAAYEDFLKVATAQREEHWKTRQAMDPAAIQSMTVEQFRAHQTDMMQSRIESKTKVFEARQKFTATLTAEQKKLLDDSFGPGMGKGKRGPHGGGWMM
ncbi:MAG: Spy/CpxP family protein refolding chaperone [Alphaproteobacteria bacterium]|nr:Spy/CpxP family protein refolding chaperone [Alphaproteobacteria bacterium]